MTATGGRPSPLPAAAPRTLPCHPAPHTCRDASIPVPTWWLSPSPLGPFSNGLDFNTSNLFSCSQPKGAAARQSQPLGSICPFSPPAHSCQTSALTETSKACPVSSPGSDTASTRRKDADNHWELQKPAEVPESTATGPPGQAGQSVGQNCACQRYPLPQAPWGTGLRSGQPVQMTSLLTPPLPSSANSG